MLDSDFFPEKKKQKTPIKTNIESLLGHKKLRYSNN